MKFNWAFLIPIASKIIQHVSPDLRKAMIDAVGKLDVKARSTKNPIDDIAVMILKASLGL